MTKGALFFCIGLPRSGKSTFCNKWVLDAELDTDTDYLTDGDGEEHRFTVTNGVKYPRVVIGGDDFRVALYGRHFQAEAEGTVFSAMDIATRALVNRGFHCIIDETSTTEQTLMRYLRIDMDATPVWIDTPVEECKRRAVETGKPYLVGPIDRLHKQMTHLKENWDTIWNRCRNQVLYRKTQDIAV